MLDIALAIVLWLFQAGIMMEISGVRSVLNIQKPSNGL